MSEVRKAWECPKCGRVLAPHVDSCPWCVPPDAGKLVRKTGPWTSPYQWSGVSGPFYYYSTITKTTEEKPSE